ncbi:MAG: hypothetical protein OXI87_21185 [Albidovulum sp.]|nr:hypothetical protein [Albidovulum sp.]
MTKLASNFAASFVFYNTRVEFCPPDCLSWVGFKGNWVTIGQSVSIAENCDFMSNVGILGASHIKDRQEPSIPSSSFLDIARLGGLSGTK